MNCLVIGGTGAVGLELCKLLGESGSRVGLSYFANKAAASELLEHSSVDFVVQCDLADANSIKSVFSQAKETWDHLDAVIVCAAYSANSHYFDPQRSAYEVDTAALEDIEKGLRVNSMGVLIASRYAVQALTGNGGNIILLGSLDGIKAIPSPTHFALAKSSLKGLTESLAKQVGKFNIKINLIAPGLLSRGASHAVSADAKQEYLKYCSLKRLGEPQEIAEMCTWFALKNSYITGQSIVLDGGL